MLMLKVKSSRACFNSSTREVREVEIGGVLGLPV